MRPNYEEVIKLVEEMNAASKDYYAMKEQKKGFPLGQNERIALEELARKVHNLNKKRKVVLALFTPEEREEIKALAQRQK